MNLSPYPAPGERWSRLVARRMIDHHRPILLAWGAALIALLAVGVPRFGDQGMSLGDLAPAGAPEIATEMDAVRLFRVPLNARSQVVRRNPAGLRVSTIEGDLQGAYSYSRIAQDPRRRGDIALALPYSNVSRLFPASRETSTTTIVNLVGRPEAGLRAREAAAGTYAERMRDVPDGRVSRTGGIPAQLASGRIIADHLHTLEIASVAVLVLITAVWFRSVAVPLVVVAAIGVTTLLLMHVLALASRWLGVAVPSEVLPVVTVVAIGVVTDYALFTLSAWSAHATTRDARTAALSAVAETLPTVAAAAFTTGIGVASLLLADMGFIRAFAPALIAAVAVAGVVAMALVPCLVALCGDRVLWPRRVARADPMAGGVLRSSTLGVLRRRRAVVRTLVAAVLVGLVTCAGFVRAAPGGFNVVTDLPPDSEVARGATDAAEAFAAGILSPTLLVVDGSGLDDEEAGLVRLTREIERIPGVAGVLGPGSLRAGLERAGLGDAVTRLEDELATPADAEPATGRAGAGPRSASDVLAGVSRGVLVTRDGHHARLVVVLDREAYTGAAADTARRLRAELPAAVERAGLEGARVRVAGDSALVARVVDGLDRDLVRILLVLVPLQLGVLTVFLRDLLMSALIVALSVLTTAAALGAAALYDVTAGPGDGLVFFLPVAAAVLLLSIGVDYGVLVGRAALAARARGARGDALAAEVVATAGPTVAVVGVVLAATFATLALVPLDSFRQFAVVMSGGALVDTLLVRPLIMPMLLTLRGERHAG